MCDLQDNEARSSKSEDDAAEKEEQVSAVTISYLCVAGTYIYGTLRASFNFYFVATGESFVEWHGTDCICLGM